MQLEPAIQSKAPSDAGTRRSERYSSICHPRENVSQPRLVSIRFALTRSRPGPQSTRSRLLSLARTVSSPRPARRSSAPRSPSSTSAPGPPYRLSASLGGCGSVGLRSRTSSPRRASSPGPPNRRSLPRAPQTTSSPGPPSSSSSPLPPNSRSLPGPPSMMSSPGPPQMSSFPARARITSFPSSPQITSRRAVPVRTSAPVVPVIVQPPTTTATASRSFAAFVSCGSPNPSIAAATPGGLVRAFATRRS